MENIVSELVKIHNENFKNRVGDKYFSEMMLGEQYEIYCLFNFTGENIFVEKLKKEDKNKTLEKSQKEKTDLEKLFTSCLTETGFFDSDTASVFVRYGEPSKYEPPLSVDLRV